jgi:hypothetical protein
LFHLLGYWPDRIGEFPGSCEEPSEPAVLGGLMTPFAVIPVGAKGLLLAVFMPWLLPPNVRKAISTTAAIKAIQPKEPLRLSPCDNPV